MKIYFGLHKTIDDEYTSVGNYYLNEKSGIIVELEDGRMMAVDRKGNIFCNLGVFQVCKSVTRCTK
jgi:hypothetical protein